MIEIRFHGRGGQGAVLASQLLAEAAFLDGRYPQSFPFFGVERRGAPVTAFARVDDRPISVRTAIDRPDVVVVLDPGLLTTTAVTDGLNPGGVVLVNSPRAPDELPTSTAFRRAAVDASAIAVRHGIGSRTMPIVNTAVLGGLARATGVVSLTSVRAAILRSVPLACDANCDAAADGFAELRSIPPDPLAPLPGPAVPPGPTPPMPPSPMASRSSESLRTAAWRSLFPEIDLARCTRCTFCWKFCPDDAIELDAFGVPTVRATYCKGCGICAEVCPPHAIAMRPSSGEAAP